MFARYLLLVSMGLGCLSQLPSTAAAQALITVWGSFGSGPGQFLTPVGVAVGGSGNVYVSDGDNNRIQVFASGGSYLRQWSMPRPPQGALNIAVDTNDNVYVAAWTDLVIYRFTNTGVLVTQWPVASSAALAVDASGHVYSDTGPGVQEFSSSGSLIREWGFSGAGGGQPTLPDGLAVDASDNVYVADIANQRILKFANDGTYITQWGSPGVGDGQFGEDSPVRAAVGPEGNVYVVDYANNRVQAFTGDGTFITKWGSYGSSPGQFFEPIGIAVDANGYIYVADKANYRIQKFGFGPTPVLSATWGALKNRYRGVRAASQLGAPSP
jgi:tripartite motif-containing protein 71